MELKLKADPTFWEKVGIPVPGKGVVEVGFEFKHRTRDELKKFVDEESEGLDDVAYTLAVAVNWEFTDEFNKKNISELVQNYLGFPKALARTYIQSLSGERLKN